MQSNSFAPLLAGVMLASTHEVDAQALPTGNANLNRGTVRQQTSPPPIYPGKWPFAPRLRPAAPPPLEQPKVRTSTETKFAVAETCPYLVNVVKKAPARVVLGETFACEVKLVAQSDVAEVLVAETLPAGALPVSSLPAATPEGGRLVWRFPTLDRGASKTITITLRAEKAGTLAGSTVVSANPRVSVTTTVVAP